MGKKEDDMAIVDWTFTPNGGADREFDRLRRQVEEVFGRFSLGSGLSPGFPRMNIYDQENDVIVAVEAPGLASEDLAAEERENILTLSGRRDLTDFGDGAVLRAERAGGEFRRTLRLPFKVRNDKIEASIKDGMLLIRMPKSEEVKTKRIAIHA
jgi:HSP20 family protein